MEVDADGGMYLLAFAIVEGETQAVWHWFISRIYDLISSVHQDKKITFISDRYKGIPNTLRDGWPSPYTHRYCLRHVRANFQKKFKDKNASFTVASQLCIGSRIVQGTESKSEICV